MIKPATLVLAGAAVLATAGAAHAQDRAVSDSVGAEATGAAVPWYQRFTTSSGVTETITGVDENDRLPMPSWTVNRNWGVTVDVREAQRIERLPEGGRGDQTSLGAYYQFTPSLRVGGQFSIESPDRPGAPAEEDAGEERRAGVRVESAFRF